MRVVSINLNGIRAAGRKGFFEWLTECDPDIVCMQETKAHMSTLTDPLYYPQGYHHYFCDAEKKGYSGVGLYVKEKPKAIHQGLGFDIADKEGRYIQADFKDFSVVSLYLPSGSSGEERQAAKYVFLDRFLPHLKALKESGRQVILCGDWNIAHKNIDIKNWKTNQKTSGFLPEERAWLDTLFNEVGFVDGFRLRNQEADQYTWWSMRQRAWEKNVGWRIDYHIITPGLSEAVKTVSIYREQQFSDHAPVIIDYDLGNKDFNT